MQVVERWILARLRHHTFFSLAEVNAALQPLVPALNARPFKKLPGSRQGLFETLDRPALRSLPVQPYAYAEWKHARVNIDYHVDVDGHSYSVPYTLVKQQLDVRLSAQVVELLYKGGIHLKRDSRSSITYSEELISSTISVTLQSTDRHYGIMGQERCHFQRDS